MAYDKKSFIMGLAVGLATKGVLDTSVGVGPSPHTVSSTQIGEDQNVYRIPLYEDGSIEPGDSNSTNEIV